MGSSWQLVVGFRIGFQGCVSLLFNVLRYSVTVMAMVSSRYLSHGSVSSQMERLMVSQRKITERIYTLVEMLRCLRYWRSGGPRRLTENSARSEDGRKLRIKIRFCEVNSGAICRTKADF